MALTVKFERSLQAVAPAIALPYWDFTIDAEDIFAHKDGNFTQYWFETEVRHHREETGGKLVGWNAIASSVCRHNAWA